jgi:hypothetical protein
LIRECYQNWSPAGIFYNLEWWEVLGSWNSIVNRLNKQNKENENYAKKINKKDGQKTAPATGPLPSTFRRKAMISDAAKKTRERILKEMEH